MKFYIVDVFATERFSGNQVAIVERNKNISAKEMQKIAQEMNFTETIFFSPEKDKRGRYNARIFTPEKEVEFSGHAIVGCAYVLINYYAKRHNLKYVHFQLIHESVKIEIEHGKEDDIGGDVFWIEEQEPVFGHEFEKILFSRILSIEPEKIDDQFPIVEVDTGLPMIIVPIKNLESQKYIKINKKRYKWLTDRAEAKCILTFTHETYHQENQINARVFADYFGIPEDPATGSGNGGLCAYLLKNDYLSHYDLNDALSIRDPDREKNGHEGDKDPDLEIKIEQGYEINRPSIIYGQTKRKNEEYNIRVGGNVILVAEGQFQL